MQTWRPPQLPALRFGPQTRTAIQLQYSAIGWIDLQPIQFRPLLTDSAPPETKVSLVRTANRKRPADTPITYLMNHRSQPRFIIYCSTLLIASMLLLAAFSVKTLTGIADAQQAHARAFIPAKQLTSDFERETLNARISFLYFVTIQKPDSLASGWQRYHNAEARLHDLAVLVEEHPDLTDLRAPVATLQKDAANYSTALSATLKLIQGGQVNGPQYEAQVKDWTACGAVLVKDAGDIEKLTVDSEKIETSNLAKALRGEQSTALLLFGGTIFLCFVLASFLLRSASIHDAEEEASLVGAAQ